MRHHEFCLFCAVSYDSGPCYLRHESHFTDRDFAEELPSVSPHLSLPEPLEIVDILKDLFEELSRGSNLLGWLDEGGPDRRELPRVVAIGHWDDEGDGVYQMIQLDDSERAAFPTGRGVSVLVCSSNFSKIFVGTIGTSGHAEEDRLPRICCDAYEENPCFALHETCYHYLRSWLEPHPHFLSPPSRAADPPLTFDEELYEIVNSRKELRKSYKGSLPCIDYGVAAAGLEEHHQDYFSPVRRKGSPAIAQAISTGLRRYELVPAIKLDFRTWIYASPDIWPTPSNPQLEPLTSLNWPSTNRETTCLRVLPDELLHHIAIELDISSFLTFSSSCYELRMRLFSPEFSDSLFHTHVLSETGSLQWILPVESCPGELDRASCAVKQWLPAPKGAYLVQVQSPSSLFDDPSLPFPYFHFVRACHLSMSMMNRRRLWGMMKQFQCIWEDYRVNGWEVDRFFGADDTISDRN
ncbi:hypothetical protein ONZ45_g19091 [Pleurotus djamor]|nr:hypothetical protein ONZ45_g19091 [Pleurotus djamor]